MKGEETDEVKEESDLKLTEIPLEALWLRASGSALSVELISVDKTGERGSSVVSDEGSGVFSLYIIRAVQQCTILHRITQRSCRGPLFHPSVVQGSVGITVSHCAVG